MIELHLEQFLEYKECNDSLKKKPMNIVSKFVENKMRKFPIFT